MTLTEKFSPSFSEVIRKEGELLEASCHRRWGSEDRIACDFEDGTECNWGIEQKKLVPHCSCGKKGACGHLWAALVAAEKAGDLTKALQRNISKRLFTGRTDGMSLQECADEVQYVPEKQPRYGRNGEERTLTPEQSSGGVSTLATAPAFSLERPTISEVPVAVRENSAVQILYVVRPDLNLAITEKPYYVLPVELWWRSAPSRPGEKPGPARIFLLNGDSSAPTRSEALFLQHISPYQAPPPSRPNLYLFPAAKIFPAEITMDVPNLKWCDTAGGGHVLRPLSVPIMPTAFFCLQVTPLENGRVQFEAFLDLSDGRKISLSQVNLIAQAPPERNLGAEYLTGYALAEGMLIPVDFHRGEEIAQQFVRRGRLVLDYSVANALCRTIALQTEMDTAGFPASLQTVVLKDCAPIPRLYIRTAKYKYHDAEQLHAELSFQYGNTEVSEEAADMRVQDGPRVICRDLRQERIFRDRLAELSFRMATKAWEEEPGWKLKPALLNECVQILVMEGWLINAEGKNYRKPTMKTPAFSSGQDWFELGAGISFDGKSLPWPALLSAIRKQQNSVRLDDGTYGLLPQEWLEKFTVLTEIGEVTSDKVRFRIEQATLVNSILRDNTLQENAFMRQVLQQNEGDVTPQPMKPPKNFCAILRPYQEVGLGWLQTMHNASLGCCLADDMGLGKTIQVLALLALNYSAERRKTALAVMPRSLIFNWQEETRKFAPWMTTAVYWGAGRAENPQMLLQYDIVFTTYGTLRNDAVKLSKVTFEYCILDESQAIKNSESSTAKAACCIQARHRIAMTGTPIENNLFELFSQLSFLNPGLFGRDGGSALCQLFARRPGDELRKTIQPYLLRRTKQSVAKDLPEKTEQILWAEMEEKEQREYDDLRNWYRKELSENPQGGMQMLAALTRLRQAACHPGLIREERLAETSAKLELLFSQLMSLLESGHKALVFSQFTTFLKVIRTRLEAAHVKLCYLDGNTKDRQDQVQLFQEDEERKVFLISLKAGGVGLNLTAADYVFIMDPWWNPATESQAIDRAYRIGQKRAVFAYRIATKNTIEEKVLNLQQSKRSLAEAVINEETGAAIPFSLDEIRALI